MGVYEVGKLLFEVSRNPRLVEQFQADPEPFLDQYHLSEAEKAAIRNKDVRFLYDLGVNPYQMTGAVRLLGVERSQYFAAIADAKPHRELSTVWFPGPTPEVREAQMKQRR